MTFGLRGAVVCAVASGLALAACGDDAGPDSDGSLADSGADGAQLRDVGADDAAAGDSALRSDGGGQPTDASRADSDLPPTGRCGGSTCDPTTEICVHRLAGLVEGEFECVNIPEGCAGDLTCGCVKDTICPERIYLCQDRESNDALPPRRFECQCVAC